MRKNDTNMLIYLKLDQYLRQWCIHEHGNPVDNTVSFPRGSAENNILELFLTTPPRGNEPELPADGTLAINVPAFKAKPAPYYNYLSQSARDLLRHTIYIRLKLQLWHDLHRFSNLDVELSGLIYTWMEAHGITNDDDRAFETLRQMYYRQRKRYKTESVKNVLKNCEKNS